MFQSLKTVLFYCTAKWKAGHINTFSQNPCPPLPFCSPSQKQRKTTKHFNKPGGKVLTYCGFKSLLNHGAAAPSLTILMNISLTSNSFARLAAGAVATCPIVYGKGPHPTLSEGGQRGSEDLPWLEIWACFPLNFFLPLPSCRQV